MIDEQKKKREREDVSVTCRIMSIGITNHDEYSLVRENQEEEAENKPNFGTLTLRRKKEGEKERDQKMEQLKKKIKTDDEREWISSFCHLHFLFIFLQNILYISIIMNVNFK